MNDIPILYTFRRCPYAMRARLGLVANDIRFEWREILLRDKPAEFLAASSDGTVPILVDKNHVIEESLDILKASFQYHDFDDRLITIIDHDFKPLLDAYKYKNDCNKRDEAAQILSEITPKISKANKQTRYAILPFIRQFAHVDLNWFEDVTAPELLRILNEFKSSALFTKIMEKHKPWQKGDEPIIFGQNSL